MSGAGDLALLRAGAALVAGTAAQNAQIRTSFDVATKRALAPAPDRDGFPGTPIGVDQNGYAIGQVNEDGSIVVGGLDIRLVPIHRDTPLTQALMIDAAGNNIAVVDQDGRVLLAGITLYRSPDRDGPVAHVLLEDEAGNPIALAEQDGRVRVLGISFADGDSTYRDALSSFVLLEDEAGNPIATVDEDSRVLLKLHPDSIPSDIGGPPDGVMTYTVGAEGARTLRLWISGQSVDTRIAVDAGVTDILDARVTATAVLVLEKTSSSLRQISIPLVPQSSLLTSVTTVWGLFGRGQSNRAGQNNDSAVTPTPLNPGRGVMFNVGERITGTDQQAGNVNVLATRAGTNAIVDLFAVDQGATSQTIGPTMAAGIIARAASTLGVIVSDTAIGGQAFSTRVRGTPQYSNFLLAVERGATMCRLTGKAFIVPCYDTIDGEANGGDSQASWLANELQDQIDIQTDVQAITSQTQAVIRVTDQMGYGISGVTLAQLQVALENPATHICVGPKYFLAGNVPFDTIHLSGLSQAIWGYHYARAISRKLIDGVNPVPLYIKTAVRGGNTVVCTFDGDFTGPVVIDTARVSDPGNYGITWLDSTTSATVTSVAITGANQITVTLSGVPTGSNPRVGCARTPSVSAIGPTSGPRSCFRDSSTDTCVINGVTYPLYRWAAHWETPVT